MQRYTRTAIVLHWLIALLIVAAFTLGLVMTEIHGITPAKLRYYNWHKWAGVTVLLLAALRLLWRLGHRPPPLTANTPAWQRKASGGVHHLLYVLMFAVPLTGYFMTLAAGRPVVYFGLFQLPVLIGPDKELAETLEEVHEWLNWFMAGVVALHVLAALKHAFIDRDDTMRRMLPGRNQP